MMPSRRSAAVDRTRVTGEFPRVASTQFIGPERGNDRPLEPMPNDQLVIGVDVARFGDDMSVIYPRRGMDARSILPLTFRSIPLDRLEDQIVAWAAQASPPNAVVPSTPFT
jgi:hypothetical protein